jgi:phosphohistidine swiveling domain-containing protein
VNDPRAVPAGESETFDDPLLGPPSSARFWTTVNAAEALPGVPTPMNWTWYDEGTEAAMLRGLALMGARPADSVIGSADRDERHLAIFHGRAALNVDLWRRMADAIPGTSGGAFERDILGSERPGMTSRTMYERYPAVVLKAPGAVKRAARQIREGTDGSKQWWRERVARVQGAEEPAARAAFGQAFARYVHVATAHLVATMAAQGLYDGVKRLSDAVGLPGHESKLTTGLGTEEGAILDLLWRVSRGAGPTVADFVNEFGYQGPQSGEISNTCWREQPALLDSLLEMYRSLPEAQGPVAIAARQQAERIAAERELLGRLPRLAHRPVRGLLGLARSYLPFRESGRAEVLRAVDVGRAAARAFAAIARPDGRLAEPEDVFMLTIREMVGTVAMPGPDELVFRRERRDAYRLVTIPDVFQGTPDATPIETTTGGADDGPIAGVGTGGGVVEGRVRVVHDPSEYDDMEPGEILVCHTTDPSWASLFMMATAVVIDIGGPMSHGAIVARELGIPCVINTKVGSRRLQTGEMIRVDGRTGTVEQLR